MKEEKYKDYLLDSSIYKVYNGKSESLYYDYYDKKYLKFLRQTNIILLKSRRTGYSYSNLKIFEWQKEYLRKSKRIKMIKSIFNI